MKITINQIQALGLAAQRKKYEAVLSEIRRWRRHGARLACIMDTDDEILLDRALQESRKYGLAENALEQFAVILAREGIDKTVDVLVEKLREGLSAQDSIPIDVKMYAVRIMSNFIKDQIKEELKEG